MLYFGAFLKYAKVGSHQNIPLNTVSLNKTRAPKFTHDSSIPLKYHGCNTQGQKDKNESGIWVEL